ncbi:uncharacterized protein PHACADRAFT_247029 [Phanerochaete carnosa HHB-10118-sp]|uniref:Uncharacterized protein n=1 Tax=Phanerochaete carnosa (strain HHB-10118-sp) TaxID=650164 RepID=K5WNT5_PHACS|nr:uncharacterized protein PHACADRAFT_247029 [Phanerochaete carnosa HHB-10118-sp]EKM60849.1 hypothetical protein PHACADRAFT_247029 [Phanerochaete carnosa HHB-10118-sp]
MYPSFNPGIGSYTTIHVPEIGDAHLRFTASFPSRESLEQARREDIRVEMWTNMPVNGSNGDWHAVPFVFPEDAKAEQSAPDLALAPAVDAPAVSDRDIYLDMVLPNSLCGSRYSFTYRLVRSWGLEWLGGWGHNGDLVLERYEERFALAEGCSLKEGVVVCNSAESVPAIQLKEPSNWTSWVWDEEGWATYSPEALASASKAVLLVPRLAENFRTRGISQPLFLYAGAESSSAVGVSAEGKVSAHNSSRLTILDPGAVSFIESARSMLPGLEIIGRNDGYAVFKSRVAEDSAPASVSVVPAACAAIRKGTRLTYDDLLAVCPHISKERTALVDLAQPAFITVSTDPSDLSVEIGPYGGKFVLSPLHVLEQANEELPWHLAVLSPSSFARIATETSKEELARLLPTPPPSPPPTSASLTSSSSFSMSASSGMSISLPSIAEIVAKEMEPAAPLTPLSPPLPSEDPLYELSEEQAEDAPKEPESKEIESKESERQVTLPTSRSQPIRGGLLRLLFAWLFRSVIARVFGFFAPVARYWGMPSYWFYIAKPEKKQEAVRDDEHKIEDNVNVDPTVNDEVDAKSDADGAQEEDKDYLNTYDSIGAVASPSGTTLAESDDELPEKEHYTPSKIEVAPSMETVVHALEDRPAPVFISPRASPKPRFLADIGSNTVSLLVRAPHARRALSDLKIHLGGKPIAEGDAGYSCARVSDNVFLLGLQGSQEGGRLEIAVD